MSTFARAHAVTLAGSGGVPLPREVLDALFFHSPTGIVVTDVEGRFLVANEALCRLVGRTEAELRATSVLEVVHLDDLEAEVEWQQKLFAGQIDSYEVEQRWTRSDGTVVRVEQRVSQAWGSALSRAFGRTDPYVLRQVVDVAERRITERDLRLARDAAQQADRTKSGFISRISHEIRSPLNAILGFAELMELDPLDARQRERVSHVLTAARHILDLINDLLDISRIEIGELRFAIDAVDVGPVLREVCELASPVADAAAIAVTCVEPVRDVVVEADHRRLVQVLLNLVTNAVKYNRANGAVDVSVEVRDDHVHLHVRDTGPGLTKEQQLRLFVPFDRLGAEHSAMGGTGLGLPLSKSLVEAMGGELRVRSEPGTGSVFSVVLPASSASSRRDATRRSTWSPERHAVLAARRWRVLLVEDDAIHARLVRAVLARWTDIEVVVVTTAAEALQRVACAGFDLIVLDINLPDADGLDLVKALRRRHGEKLPPVVVSSADVFASTLDHARLAGATAFLPKPVDIGEILDVLADVLRRAVP